MQQEQQQHLMLAFEEQKREQQIQQYGQLQQLLRSQQQAGSQPAAPNLLRRTAPIAQSVPGSAYQPGFFASTNGCSVHSGFTASGLPGSLPASQWGMVPGATMPALGRTTAQSAQVPAQVGVTQDEPLNKRPHECSLERSRERNREHAKKSRMRKKEFLDSLSHKNDKLKDHQEQMLAAMKKYMPADEANWWESRCNRLEEAQQGDEVDGADMPVSCNQRKDSYPVVERAVTENSRPSSQSGSEIATAMAGAGGALSFVICDARLPGCPVIFATQGFLELTGFILAEVVGKAWSFLQGDGNPDADTIAEMTRAVVAGAATSHVVTSYRKDGSAFKNYAMLSPLKNPEGQTTNFVAVQAEATEKDGAHPSQGGAAAH